MFSTTRIQIGLNARPERVFRALTESTALCAWFSEHAEIDLTHNQYDFWGKFTPKAPDRNVGRHAIVESIPGQMLAYRWQVDGDSTRVTYRLYPRENGTILTMQHAPDGEQSPEPGGFEDFWFLSLENLRRYLDGKPSDARADYTNPMRGDIRHETEIDAPLTRVFEVLTNPDELNRWIATNAKVQPEKGGEYNLGWMYEGEDMGASKIIDIEANHQIVLDLPPDPYSQKATVLTWVMRENNGKTWLTFTHSGFDADQDVGGLYTGWRNFVNWVRSVSEYGAAWQPPISVLKPDSIGYPGAMYAAQDQIVEELRIAS
ncbi:MAG: SRPBCC domain-containing protein [Anaerolineae bacterium]